MQSSESVFSSRLKPPLVFLVELLEGGSTVFLQLNTLDLRGFSGMESSESVFSSGPKLPLVFLVDDPTLLFLRPEGVSLQLAAESSL